MKTDNVLFPFSVSIAAGAAAILRMPGGGPIKKIKNFRGSKAGAYISPSGRTTRSTLGSAGYALWEYYGNKGNGATTTAVGLNPLGIIGSHFYNEITTVVEAALISLDGSDFVQIVPTGDSSPDSGNLEAGDEIRIEGVVGMAGINGSTGLITDITDGVITTDIDGSGFVGAYVSGGIVYYSDGGIPSGGDYDDPLFSGLSGISDEGDVITVTDLVWIDKGAGVIVPVLRCDRAAAVGTYSFGYPPAIAVPDLTGGAFVAEIPIPGDPTAIKLHNLHATDTGVYNGILVGNETTVVRMDI